jgi:hypothetical protein
MPAKKTANGGAFVCSEQTCSFYGAKQQSKRTVPFLRSGGCVLSLCWLLEASAEKREGFISQYPPQPPHVNPSPVRKVSSSEDGSHGRLQGSHKEGPFPLVCGLHQCKTAKRNDGLRAPR